MLRLYGTPPTRATKALWVIRELDLPCELIFVSLRRGDHRRPEFLALNPAGRIPVLVDGDLVITESVAMCLYLAERYPAKTLIPGPVELKAQMYRWLFFLATEVEAHLDRIDRHTSLYPEERRSTSEIALAREEAWQGCSLLEAHLQKHRRLVGDQLSVADFVAAYTLDWANELGFLEKAPALRGYQEDMYSLASAPPTVPQAYAALASGLPVDWRYGKW